MGKWATQEARAQCTECKWGVTIAGTHKDKNQITHEAAAHHRETGHRVVAVKDMIKSFGTKEIDGSTD